MAEQLAFSLSTRPALGRDDFFVSDANELALATLEATETWPNGKLILAGPTASGKTHLSHVWAGEQSARIIPANGLSECDIPDTADGPLVIEDIDLMSGEDEVALFHLHNLMQAEGHPLLMTSTMVPAQMDVALPDLLSRLQGTALVSMEAPDDSLLAVVLLKMFADRQINLPTELLGYVLPRIERSFAAAREFVDALDARALRENKPIGKKLAGEILKGHGDENWTSP